VIVNNNEGYKPMASVNIHNIVEFSVSTQQGIRKANEKDEIWYTCHVLTVIDNHGAQTEINLFTDTAKELITSINGKGIEKEEIRNV